MEERPSALLKLLVAPMASYVFLCLVGLVAPSTAYDRQLFFRQVKDGLCPNHLRLKHFNFDMFLGEWFVIQEYKPPQVCRRYLFRCVKSGKILVTETYGFKPPTTMIKVLKYGCNSSSKISLHKGGRDIFPWVVRFLATDYSSYAAVFLCREFGLVHYEAIEIWSRTRSIDPATLAKVRDYLTSMNVDLEGVTNTDQRACDPSHGRAFSKNGTKTTTM